MKGNLHPPTSGLTLLAVALFSNQFRYERQRLKLSRAEASRRSGVPLHRLRRFEKSDPGTLTLAEVATLARSELPCPFILLTPLRVSSPAYVSAYQPIEDFICTYCVQRP